MDYCELRKMASNETWISAESMLNEATYYGKNDKLLKAQNILDEMVKLGHANKIGSQEFVDKLSELEKLMANIFGFADFTINSSIIQCNPAVLFTTIVNGGTTICSAVYIKYTKMAMPGGSVEMIDLDKNHKGVAFKKGSNYKMMMLLSMELFMDRGEYSFTGSEILAFMLHEIGHNFYYGPVHEISEWLLGFVDIRTYKDLLSMILQQLLLANGTREIDTWLYQKFPDARKEMAKISTTIGMIGVPVYQTLVIIKIFQKFNTLFGLLARTVTLAVNTIIINTIKGILGYDAEKYADAFASSYGYGMELSSALMKLDHVSNSIVPQNKTIQTAADLLYSMASLPMYLIATFLDEHPTTQQRLKNQIKYMEQSASSIKDPKLRKEYLRDINSLYSLRDQVVKYSGVNAISTTEKLEAWIQDVCKIEDPREMISVMKNGKYKNIDF